MKCEEQNRKDFKALCLIFGRCDLKKVKCLGFGRTERTNGQKWLLLRILNYSRKWLVLVGQVLRGVEVPNAVEVSRSGTLKYL